MEREESAVLFVAASLASEHEGRKLEGLPTDLQMKYLADARWSLARQRPNVLDWRVWLGLVVVLAFSLA